MNTNSFGSILSIVEWAFPAVTSVVASAVAFFLLVKVTKWIRGGNVSTLDQRITSYMPQNSYGKHRGVKKSGYYKSGHEI